ncbi:MAG: DUF421 domain-containing protein [Clostridia bacterium]|nr:DUF421 domain-containing protein [Clostridia bacterium]
MIITAIRTVIIYVFLMLAMRVMGKRQLGELQPAELVVTLLIADLAVVPMQETSIPLFGGLIPILVLVSLELIVSALMMKLPALSRLISGNPIVIIRDGVLDEQALVKLRLTVEDLMESLREQQIHDIRDIRTAIVETNGKISVIPTRKSSPATCEDLSLEVSEDTVMYLVVSDGRRCRWTYPLCGIQDQDIDRALKKRKLRQQDVLMMTCNRQKEFLIVRKGEGL